MTKRNRFVTSPLFGKQNSKVSLDFFKKSQGLGQRPKVYWVLDVGNWMLEKGKAKEFALKKFATKQPIKHKSARKKRRKKSKKRGKI